MLAGISAFWVWSVLHFSSSINSQCPSTAAALQPSEQSVASVNRVPRWLVRNAEKFQWPKNRKACLIQQHPLPNAPTLWCLNSCTVPCKELCQATEQPAWSKPLEKGDKWFWFPPHKHVDCAGPCHLMIKTDCEAKLTEKVLVSLRGKNKRRKRVTNFEHLEMTKNSRGLLDWSCVIVYAVGEEWNHWCPHAAACCTYFPYWLQPKFTELTWNLGVKSHFNKSFCNPILLLGKGKTIQSYSLASSSEWSSFFSFSLFKTEKRREWEHLVQQVKLRLHSQVPHPAPR